MVPTNTNVRDRIAAHETAARAAENRGDYEAAMKSWDIASDLRRQTGFDATFCQQRADRCERMLRGVG